jgi:hypothetical protein
MYIKDITVFNTYFLLEEAKFTRIYYKKYTFICFALFSERAKRSSVLSVRLDVDLHTVDKVNGQGFLDTSCEEPIRGCLPVQLRVGRLQM